MHLVSRTTVAAIAVLAVAAPTAAVVAPASAGPAGQSHRAAPKDPNATPFALRAWGYSTRVIGGDVPSTSSPTAYESISCTNRVGLNRTNNIANLALPSLGTVDGAKTQVWTTRKARVVSSYARNTIGKVVLSDSPLGSLTLDAVSTTARAYHDGSKFRTATNTDLAKLTFKPAMGPAQTMPIPTPNRPVVIPGFAKVTIAQSRTPKTKNGARAFANGIKVHLIASDSYVQVAHAVAQIGDGVQTGLFSGSSYALTGNAAAGLVNLGRNALLKMPCQGTDGAVRTRSVSSTDASGEAAVGAAKSEEMAQQNGRRAWGYVRSRVASLNLGDQLRIEGIIGQVNVSRSGKHLRNLKRTTKGTTVGTIHANGQDYAFPDTGVLEIPGVAKLERAVTKKLTNGLALTALRITLLDGTGAVIDLGNVRFQVRRSTR